MFNSHLTITNTKKLTRREGERYTDQAKEFFAAETAIIKDQYPNRVVKSKYVLTLRKEEDAILEVTHDVGGIKRWYVRHLSVIIWTLGWAAVLGAIYLKLLPGGVWLYLAFVAGSIFGRVVTWFEISRIHKGLE